MRNLTDSHKSIFGNWCESAPEVIQNYTISSPFCFKELSVAGLNQLNRNSSLLVFFPFLLLFSKLFIVFFRGNVMYNESYSIPVQTRLFCVHFSTRKTVPLWSRQISFLNDYEATREARMLQAPITGITHEPLSKREQQYSQHVSS